MDLIQLKYFQAVAKYEHMTQAANELHIAQPSLSKVISRLEEDLGVSLFDRIGRHIKLNQFGKVFLHRVEKMFIELEEGKMEISDILENENKKITFAANNLYSFSKLLGNYIKLYPNISLHQIVGSTSKIQQQIQNGGIDFCISSPPIIGNNIECIPLIAEEIFLFVPRQHKFAKRSSINLIEAADEHFISLPEGFGLRYFTEKLCHQSGFTPNIIFESDITTSLVELVSFNLGVALLPVSERNSSIENFPIPIQITEPVCTRTIALSYVKGRYMPKATSHLIDYIVNYFKNVEHNK